MDEEFALLDLLLQSMYVVLIGLVEVLTLTILDVLQHLIWLAIVHCDKGCDVTLLLVIIGLLFHPGWLHPGWLRSGLLVPDLVLND